MTYRFTAETDVEPISGNFLPELSMDSFIPSKYLGLFHGLGSSEDLRQLRLNMIMHLIIATHRGFKIRMRDIHTFSKEMEEEMQFSKTSKQWIRAFQG